MKEINNAVARPSTFDGFVCDPVVKTRILDCVTAAKMQCTMPPHMLLTGGPGTGKTTIAGIIARTLNVPILKFLGRELRNRAQLSSLYEFPEYGGILFIDEIHSVSKEVAELLYPVMEDGTTNAIGDPSLTIYLNPIMVIGATTEPGSLEKPLRDRFVVKIDIKPYTEEQMLAVVSGMAGKFKGVKYTPAALEEVAKRSKSTPRIAGGLLRQISDTAIARRYDLVCQEFADSTLKSMDIDQDGLDHTDHEILSALKTNSTLGLSTLAAIVGVDEASLTETYEPYLMCHGYLTRTKTGRQLTEKGKALAR